MISQAGNSVNTYSAGRKFKTIITATFKQSRDYYFLDEVLPLLCGEPSFGFKRGT